MIFMHLEIPIATLNNYSEYNDRKPVLVMNEKTGKTTIQNSHDYKADLLASALPQAP